MKQTTTTRLVYVLGPKLAGKTSFCKYQCKDMLRVSFSEWVTQFQNQVASQANDEPVNFVHQCMDKLLQLLEKVRTIFA